MSFCHSSDKVLTKDFLLAKDTQGLTENPHCSTQDKACYCFCEGASTALLQRTSCLLLHSSAKEKGSSTPSRNRPMDAQNQQVSFIKIKDEAGDSRKGGDTGPGSQLT